MKEKTYDSVEAKARRVLACCGRAPVAMNFLSADELAAVAALCDDKGQLVDDGQAKFQSLMLEINDKRKATDEADEHTVDVAAQQKLRDEAAELVSGSEPEPEAPKAVVKRKPKSTTDGE